MMLGRSCWGWGLLHILCPPDWTMDRDDRIQGLVESGEVFWYQLDPEVLEAE